MKRRITVEQLNELTEEQKQKLREWWKPEVWDVYAVYGNAIGVLNEQVAKHISKEYALPLLDIGQMIELLETEDDAGIEYYYIGENGQDLCWLYTHSCSYKAPELCDALFEAVKQVLGV